MERFESTLTPTINKALAPINEKINHCIDLVNSDEKNLKISNDLKFNSEGKPIYKERTKNAK